MKLTRRVFLGLAAAAAAPFKFLLDLAGVEARSEPAARREAFGAESIETKRWTDGSAETHAVHYEFSVDPDTLEVVPLRVESKLVGANGPISRRPGASLDWHEEENLSMKPPDSFRGLREPGELERWAAMANDADGLSERMFARDCARTLKMRDPRGRQPPTDEEVERFIVPGLALHLKVAERRYATELPTDKDPVALERARRAWNDPRARGRRG